MKIRVATYNIHKGVSGSLRKRVRIHDVKLALHSMDADIVFLQEVQEKNDRMSKHNGYPQGTQLDFLCTGSYLHRAYGMNAVYPHGHHGNAIVSRHAIGRHLNHDISDVRNALGEDDPDLGEFDEIVDGFSSMPPRWSTEEGSRDERRRRTQETSRRLAELLQRSTILREHVNRAVKNFASGADGPRGG